MIIEVSVNDSGETMFTSMEAKPGQRRTHWVSGWRAHWHAFRLIWQGHDLRYVERGR